MSLQEEDIEDLFPSGQEEVDLENLPEDEFEEDDPGIEEEDSSNADVNSGIDEDTELEKKLKQELETYKKRFHDTQQSFHKVSQEKAELRKSLDELKAKREEEDLWFSSEDEDRLDSVQKSYDEKEQEEEEALRRQQEAEAEENAKRVEIWESKAARVRNSHEDYDECVSWLNAQHGSNTLIQELWSKVDQNPQEAYRLGKALKEVFGDLDKPKKVKSVSTRDALANVNSAISTTSRGGRIDFVNSVF